MSEEQEQRSAESELEELREKVAGLIEAVEGLLEEIDAPDREVFVDRVTGALIRVRREL